MLHESIDAALMSKLNNQWQVTIEGNTHDVKAMIVAPEEQIIKAQYPVPSIGIQFFDMLHSPEREWQKIDARDNFTDNVSPTPDTVDVRTAPIKYDFHYQIFLMSYYAIHDRTLSKNILSVLPPRGSIQVADDFYAPSENYNLWAFLEDFRHLDTQGQYRIFKKVFTYRILGWYDEAVRVTKKTPSEGILIETQVPKVNRVHHPHAPEDTVPTDDWKTVL